MFLGQRIRLFHLRKNLRLAQHHAVQAGRDGEQMPHDAFAALLKEIVENLVRIQAAAIGEKLDNLLMRWRFGVLFGRGVQLDAIARRKQHRFGLRERGAP